MKLKSKTYKKYVGKVYDLSVENKNSYNVEGLPVHNSGAGSLVCYLLGITQVDPIKHGLLFERFLAKNKKGLPDIDSDCADREEAIKILIEHFGEECVLPVSNYNQLQLKSLIKDLARLYQIPFEVINPITQKIEKETLDEDKKQDGFDRGVWFLSYESAVKNSPTFNQLLEDYPQLEASIKVLFKQIKSCFTNDTLLLTDKGWKKYSEINMEDKIAFVNNVGEIEYNSDFFKIENGEKEVYKIKTANGKVIELTEDHLVQTDKGWKQVKDLTEEDSLIGWI
jgi:hypothetical protein